MTPTKKNKKSSNYRHDVLQARFKFLQKYKTSISEMAQATIEESFKVSAGCTADIFKFFETKQMEQSIAAAKKDLAIVQEMLAEVREELKSLQIEIAAE